MWERCRISEIRHLDGTEAIDFDGPDATPMKLFISSQAGLDPDTVAEVTALTEVATGTGYVAGGPSVTNPAVTTPAARQVGFDCDNFIIAQDAVTGFSNGRTFIIYEDQGLTKHALFMYEHPSAFGNVDGPIELQISPNGVVVRTL